MRCPPGPGLAGALPEGDDGVVAEVADDLVEAGADGFEVGGELESAVDPYAACFVVDEVGGGEAGCGRPRAVVSVGH